MRVLVIIPAFNEEGSIEQIINEIKKTEYVVDYLVINDCSSDDTLYLLKKNGANYLNVPINLGIGGAVKTGYKYAKAYNYDVAIQVDGDGQHDVKYIEEMVELIKHGDCDIVIGSRYINKEGFQSTITRRIGIRFLSILIRMVSGANIKDVTSGFRAVNRQFIELFAENYPDDYPEPEVIVTARLYGARIKEIPVIMRERYAGSSSINIKKSVYYMIKVSLAILVRRLELGFRRYKVK